MDARRPAGDRAAAARDSRRPPAGGRPVSSVSGALRTVGARSPFTLPTGDLMQEAHCPGGRPGAGTGARHGASHREDAEGALGPTVAVLIVSLTIAAAGAYELCGFGLHILNPRPRLFNNGFVTAGVIVATMAAGAAVGNLVWLLTAPRRHAVRDGGFFFGGADAGSDTGAVADHDAGTAADRDAGTAADRDAGGVAHRDTGTAAIPVPGTAVAPAADTTESAPTTGDQAADASPGGPGGGAGEGPDGGPDGGPSGSPDTLPDGASSGSPDTLPDGASSGSPDTLLNGVPDPRPSDGPAGATPVGGEPAGGAPAGGAPAGDAPAGGEPAVTSG
ncbi:conserved hypothetical protein [Streptomyces sp. e14]|nr:conserved hypothetical protein [Streptomyces sp. e14]